MITHLKINNLRNLNDISLSLGAVNVIIGKNGSGKTSLLESVFLLSRGKSFRHHEAKRYISHNADSCTIWAKFTDDSTLAIAKYKTDAKTELRHNQAPLASQAIASRLLPVLMIDPSGMEILEDGMANRRQLLDFLCFYAAPNFHQVWLEYNRALKQRNLLLKFDNASTNINIHHQIFAWDMILSNNAKILHDIRSEVFDKWQAEFYKAAKVLLPNYMNNHELIFHYQAGYDTDSELKALLKERLLSDIELGYTRIGSHRADLSLQVKYQLDNQKIHKEQAVNVLSRGEKKLLIIALKLSGLSLINKVKNPIILIDDIDSELDTHTCEILLKKLNELSCQLFITTLNKDMLDLLKKISGNNNIVTFQADDGNIAPLLS